MFSVKSLDPPEETPPHLAEEEKREALLLGYLSQSSSSEKEKENQYLSLVSKDLGHASSVRTLYEETYPKLPPLFERRDSKGAFLLKGGGLSPNIIRDLREEEKREEGKEEHQSFSLLELSLDACFKNLPDKQFMTVLFSLTFRFSFTFQSLVMKRYTKYRELSLERKINETNKIYKDKNQDSFSTIPKIQSLTLRKNNQASSLLELSWTICLKKFSERQIARVLFSCHFPSSLIDQYSRRISLDKKEIQKYTTKLHPKRIKEELLSQFPSLFCEKGKDLQFSTENPLFCHSTFGYSSRMTALLYFLFSFFEDLFPISPIKKDYYINKLDGLKTSTSSYLLSGLFPHILRVFPLSQLPQGFSKALDLLECTTWILQLSLKAKIFCCQIFYCQSYEFRQKESNTQDCLFHQLKLCQKMRIVITKLRVLSENGHLHALNNLKTYLESFSKIFEKEVWGKK